jgi:hypothetical protein
MELICWAMQTDWKILFKKISKYTLHSRKSIGKRRMQWTNHKHFCWRQNTYMDPYLEVDDDDDDDGGDAVLFPIFSQ